VARMIPEAIVSAEAPASERRCFEALRDGLDGSYTVLYDVAWLGRGDHEGSQGQCDFVVLHPRRGILVLEVKGGTPRREAGGQWYSAGATGDHRIDDPYQQANRSKFALRDYIRSVGNSGPASATWGHAVWFPDARAPADCGPHSHEAVTLDYRAHGQIAETIDRTYAYWAGDGGRPALGADGVSQIVRAVGRPITLRVPLALAIQAEASEERRLTEEQYRLLGMVDRRRRVAISGPAGSGKTMLAMEQCRRFDAGGLETLYVCFNRRLANFVEKEVQSLASVTANTFHGLVDVLAAEAGIALPPQDERTSEYFDQRSADILFDVASQRGPRFDALVVDEAQDFHDWWLTAVEALLRPDGRQVVFLDSNQQIFRRQGRASLIEESLRLTVNCRTTRSIHRALQPYHVGDVTDCTGPEGRPPKRVSVTSDRQEAREVQRELFHLTSEDEVPLSAIAVLTPRRETSHWKEGDKLGNFTLTWNDARDERTQVLCATIQSFKGMESDIVLLTEMSKVHADQQREMWYTALSRARHHVVIFDNPDGQS
jgi:hypothetical protein